MSRRSHHPARRHVRTHPEPRAQRPASPGDAPAATGQEPTTARPGPTGTKPVATPTAAQPARDVPPGPRPAIQQAPGSEPTAETPPLAARPEPAPSPVPKPQATEGWTPQVRVQAGPTDAERNGCTAPQLRRFIKSRAYVPMHELRRRFAIEGDDDDVTPVDMDPGVRVYVGLPNREGRLLGELLRSGDIGYELSFDPIAPIVVGVFPMRPVPRA